MIRFAKSKDIPSIMRFIDEHWKKDHILARDRAFFEYQHADGLHVNFVVSLTDSGEINGVLGFIPYGHKGKRDAMDALWKVLHTDDPFLGVNLLKYLVEHDDARLIASPGINIKTIPIYKWLGYHTGELTQWYRLGNNPNFQIATINNTQRPIPIAEPWEWKEYFSFQDVRNDFNFSGYTQDTAKPYKEPWYIEHRYFNHPIYRYRIFGLRQVLEETNTIFVFREQVYQSARALRLIDCIGKPEGILHATALVDALLADLGAEYADFYEANIPDEMMLQAGWIKVEDSGNIIPDYFAPFVRDNIKIYYFSTDPDVVLYKGDGDQDRPS